MAEKRSYTINTMRGVDLSSSPINVAASRASYMRNMISRGGVNHKRNGWSEITSFGNLNAELPINGIFDYLDPITKGKYLIVHAGRAFYKCSVDFNFKTLIATAPDVTITSIKSKAYYKDGLLWIIGCGDFLVYDGNTIVKVEDSEFAYTPTTVTHTTKSGAMEIYEKANLLSNKRKNKLIGGENASVNNYYLDGKIDTSKNVSVEIEVYFGGDFPRELKISDDITFSSGLVTLKFDCDLSNGKDFIFSTSTGICELGEGTIVDSSGAEAPLTIILKNKKDRGFINIQFCALPVVEQEANITVEYTADYERELELSVSSVMPCYGAEVLLAVHGSNVLYFSDVISPDVAYGFGYFPIDNFVIVGSDKDPITAVVPLGDSSVGVFKKNSFYRVNFTLKTESDTQEAELVPQIVESFDSAGCINQEVAVNVNADTLTFNQNGVFGVEFNTSTRSLKMRSSCVNKELCAYSYETLSGAVACEHEGRYYLFIDGKVYIADSRFKVYESNRLDTSFEYEWWLWDGCPARVACSIDGRLYMGRENGKIAVFDDKFIDRTGTTLTSGAGDLSYQVIPRSATRFYVNQNIGIENGDKVQFTNGYTCLGEFSTTIERGKGIRATIDKRLVELGLVYIGLSVYFERDDILTPYEIIDICFEGEECVLYVNAPKCEETETLLISLENKSYVVIAEDTGFSLIDELFYENENAITQCYAYISRSENLTLKLLKEEKNVECEYKTAVMSLGTEIQAKTLLKTAITVSNDTVGEVLVGYETNVNNVLAKNTVAGAFDFNALDFKTFTFESGFYKSYVKRMLERNFNYICFRFASKSGGDFAIERFTLVYTINGVLKGDR